MTIKFSEILSVTLQNRTLKTADKKPPIKTFNKKPSNKIIEQENRVLTYMKYGQEYRAAAIGELLGIKASRTKEILRYMVSSGKIEIVGNNRNRRYVLAKEGEDN